MKENIFLRVVVLFFSLIVLIALGRLGFSVSRLNYLDYEPDPYLKMRPYEEIRDEIKDNILRIGLSPKSGKKKMVLYIWDFENKSGYRVGYHKIKDDISTMLLETGKFKLVEDAVVEIALKEMNLSGTKFIDQAYVKEFGKRVGVDYIMYGSINNNSISSDPNITLVFKVIDVETTEIVWAYEIGLNKRNYRTIIDTVVEEAIYGHKNSLAMEWESINKDILESHDSPIRTISVFFVNAGRGIDESMVVDKITIALLQSRIPDLKIIDRASLSKVIEQISKEGYEESAFFKTKKMFGKFYGVDAFLYGVIFRDPATGKFELNLKMAVVESATVDWGRKFQADTVLPRKDPTAIQRINTTRGNSKGVVVNNRVDNKKVDDKQEIAYTPTKTSSPETVGQNPFLDSLGEIMGFIASAPGIGIRIGGGLFGGFTTPGMTSKSLYNDNDLFRNSIQLFSFNTSVDFLRFRVFNKTYIETGLKFWIGSYTVIGNPPSSGYQLISADFVGIIPYISFRYLISDVFFVRTSLMTLINQISLIFSRVSYKYTYRLGDTSYVFSNTIDFRVPRTNNNYFNILNWPFELEVGMAIFGDKPPYLSVILGFWSPGGYGVRPEYFEWEFGINMVMPIVWWHPMSFMYDKYLDNR